MHVLPYRVLCSARTTGMRKGSVGAGLGMTNPFSISVLSGGMPQYAAVTGPRNMSLLLDSKPKPSEFVGRVGNIWLGVLIFFNPMVHVCCFCLLRLVIESPCIVCVLMDVAHALFPPLFIPYHEECSLPLRVLIAALFQLWATDMEHCKEMVDESTDAGASLRTHRCCRDHPQSIRVAVLVRTGWGVDFR